MTASVRYFAVAVLSMDTSFVGLPRAGMGVPLEGTVWIPPYVVFAVPSPLGMLVVVFIAPVALATAALSAPATTGASLYAGGEEVN